jgi:BlaI family penicillinase repressor
MREARFSRLELKIMDALWTLGACSVREIQETFPEKDRPGYTSVQTMVARLEAKGAVRRSKKISNAHIYEALVSRAAAHRRLVDELIGIFGGRAAPLMSHLVDSGQVTLKDLEEARKALKNK